MFVVYLNGIEWCTRKKEAAAQAVVDSYDGEGDCWYEEVPEEEEEN